MTFTTIFSGKLSRQDIVSSSEMYSTSSSAKEAGGISAAGLSINLIKRCPFFSNYSLENLTISKLGGWSNTSYKLEFSNEAFVLRVNRSNPFLNMDREAEQNNSHVAESLGIGSRIIYAEPDFQVSQFIENQGIVYAEEFDDNTFHGVISTLKKLHQSGLNFQKTLNPYERLLKIYEEVKAAGSLSLPTGLDIAIKALEPAFCSETLQNVHKVPCHNDTTPYNMLRTESGIKLVDWEHAANNDPAWDMAYLSAEARFSPEQDKRMIGIYNPEDKANFTDRFLVYKTLNHLWIIVWIYTQIYSENKVMDVKEFQELAEERLSLCMKLFNQEPFKQAMKRFQESANIKALQIAPSVGQPAGK